MNGPHWTQDDFINALYGVGPEADHLDACDMCRARWEEVRARRAQATLAAEVSSEFLATQRRNVYRRLGSEPRRLRRAAPALVAALLLVVAFLAYRPATSPPQETQVAQVRRQDVQPGQQVQSSDAQLMSDIYSIEETAEPQAVQVLHALFEEQ